MPRQGPRQHHTIIGKKQSLAFTYDYYSKKENDDDQ